MCTFGTWLDRGWCRVELIALLLARQRKPPAIVIKSTEGAPFMIAPMQGTIRPPGMGSFTCCARNHEVRGARHRQLPSRVCARACARACARWFMALRTDRRLR